MSNSDGYWVPGVETKESAMVSTGEFSNLMCGVDILNNGSISVVGWRTASDVMAEILLGNEVGSSRIAGRMGHLMVHSEMDRWPDGENDEGR